MLKQIIAIALIAQSAQIWALHTNSSVTLSDPRLNVAMPQTTINAKGHAAVVWISSEKRDEVVHASERNEDGVSWTPPRMISDWKYAIKNLCGYMNEKGDLSVVWEVAASERSSNYLQWASKPFSADWSETSDLFLSPLDSVPTRNIAFEENGQLAGVRKSTEEARYLGFIPKQYLVQVFSLPSDGQVDYTTIYSSSKFLWAPNIAVHPEGNAFIFWQTDDESLFGGVYKYLLGSWKIEEGKWSSPETICTTEDYVFYPKTVIGSGEHAGIIWGPAYENKICAVTHSAKGWSEISTLSPSSDDALQPQIVMDLEGNLMAAWEVKQGKERVICASHKPVGESWTSSVDISLPDHDALNPLLAFDNAGHFILIWQEYDRNFGTVWGSQFSIAKGIFSEPALISPIGQSCIVSSLAFADTKGIISWITTSNGFDRMVQVADLTAD